MSFWEQFPYTNYHDLNISWVLSEFAKLKTKVEEFTAVNSVSYAGLWDITKQYTQWSVVSNGDSTYLASRPVPVGINITNGEYWTHLADLDPRIGGILNRLSQIDNSIEEIENLTLAKRLILIGDSYGVLPGGNSWTDKISRTFNVAKIVATGGAGFIGKHEGATFIKELESCSDVANPDTVTDIVVVGGYNDMHYVLDGGSNWKLGGEMDLFARKALQMFPNAKLHLGFAGWDMGSIYWKLDTPKMFNLVIPYYQEVCRFAANWAYISGLEFVLHAPGLLAEDKYHPNEEGATILASVIASHLVGGSIDGMLLPPSSANVNITPGEYVAELNLRGSNAKVVGSTGRLYLDYIDVKFNTDIYIGEPVEIGTLENCPFQPLSGKSSVQYSVYVDGGTQQCALFIEGRSLKFVPLTKAYTSGTKIAINWTSWVEPLI